jgi:hypothetical protein
MAGGEEEEGEGTDGKGTAGIEPGVVSLTAVVRLESPPRSGDVDIRGESGSNGFRVELPCQAGALEIRIDATWRQ